MTYLILQSCCNDASCTDVCPVDCIHPTPDEPQFMQAEMLHIDPDTCIDCGACVDECPVDAIRADHEIDAGQEMYVELNAGYFGTDSSPNTGYASKPPRWTSTELTGRRIAIVGTGPAAFYAAIELASVRGIDIEMYDRSSAPYGLVRTGVAPDHQATKSIADMFRATAGKKTVSVHLGVDIGRHITHDELLEHHDAVIYATGASGARNLEITGEDMVGSCAATDFVGWYNGDPDAAHLTFDLSSPRAVIIGNGNVALDLARILTADPRQLERTDIADHALKALRNSKIREVVIVGRRGPAHAAFTNPELIELSTIPGVDLLALPNEVNTSGESPSPGPEATYKAAMIQQAADRYPIEQGSKPRRIVLRFGMSPTSITGNESVTGIRIARTGTDGDQDEMLETSLVLRAVGCRGQAIPDVPFDEERGVIPNHDGRVVDGSGNVIPGVYVTGWIKRGPTGVIGTNKKCAAGTVRALLDDISGGRLRRAPEDHKHFDTLLAERAPEALDFSDWTAVDAVEIAAGSRAGRPRVKLVETEAIREVVRGQSGDRY